MPDRRTRNRIARRFAVFGPAAIVVLTGLLAFLALQQVRASRSQVQHTHEVLDASSVVLTALLDVETATRGFVLTHDSTFLAPARGAPERATRAVAALRALTVDNPAQQRRIDTLSAAVSLRLFTLDSATRVERAGATNLSAAVIRASRGPTQMGEVRRLVQAIRADEDSLLVIRRVAETNSMEITAAVIILGALGAAVLAFFVNRNFDLALRDRRAALVELRIANERLQEGAVELEFQAEAAQIAAADAELATEHASEARIAAEESERRAERLQTATEVFTTAIEPGDVADLIVAQAMQAIGATSGALATVEENGTELCFHAVRHFSVAQAGSTLPIDRPVPICAAVRQRRPIVLESAAEVQEKFPDVVAQHETDDVRSVAAFPMKLDDQVTGVLLVRFDHDQPIDGADRALMVAMSRIAAETFERARLFEAEREARTAAESANRAKAAFLASMSHELRTPLQAALGFAQLVRSGIYGTVNEQQSEVLGRVERSQTHLSHLIDDILDFARLEAGRVRIDAKPTLVGEVITELAPLVESQAAKKNVELSLVPPVADLAVLADRQRLQQILVNLVGNAIKFTPANGKIRVGARRNGTTASVFIEDTGMGIPADRLQAIFEPFVQVEDSLTRTAAGAGLGLAISRDLARAMGGDLEVKSELGKGSTFTVVLPLAPMMLARLRPLVLTAASLGVLIAAACSKPVPPVKQVGTAPDSFRVTFETTRGSFVVQVNRAWAPIGADRFYALVQNQFFDGDPFFRVVPGFIAQFGLNLTRKVNEQWDDPRLADDSVRQSNLRGTMTFASEGPNSRNHQLFFNLSDKNVRLDRTGFAPLGKVVQGMEVVDSLYSAYGDAPEQHFILTMGDSYLKRLFPKLDYIKTVK